MDRRVFLSRMTKGAALAATAWGGRNLAGVPSLPSAAALGDEQGGVGRAEKPLRITRVRSILTAPQGGIRLVAVKVETSEPGLYGVGCATFTQRARAVATAVDHFLVEVRRQPTKLRTETNHGLIDLGVQANDVDLDSVDTSAQVKDVHLGPANPLVQREGPGSGDGVSLGCSQA